MDLHHFQIALKQTLQNYHRCGVRYLPSDLPLHPQALQAIQSAAEAALPPSAIPPASLPVVQSVQTNASVNPSAEVVLRPQTETVTEKAIPTGIKSEAPTASVDIPFSWTGEDMDDSNRAVHFQQLDQQICACRLCSDICNRRKQTVFGTGPIRPRICFMGEAPGADEDRFGEPFVGPAGQLLTKIINAMQLRREEVYILNALKCRPPNNRTPSDQEIANCHPFVESQLETLRPEYIVCLGSVAVRSLLKKNTPVGQLRGKFFPYRGARVLVTYHPSYLLRNDAAKKLVWEDMQLLMGELGIALPNRNKPR